MPKIKVIKKGINVEDSVFEKSGIKMEFTTNDINAFLNDLDKTRTQVELVLQQLVVQLEKMEGVGEENLESIKKADWYDFMVYANSNAQLKAAQDAITELESGHPDFADTYGALTDDQKESIAKFIHFQLEKEEKDKELEQVQETIADYTATLKEATELWQKEE